MDQLKKVMAWRRREATRPEPSRRVKCSGGPFHGNEIVLTGYSTCNTMTFRVRDEVGRYVGNTSYVSWQPTPEGDRPHG